MKKALAMVIVSLVLFSGGLARVVVETIEICQWTRNGCTTSVYQFETEWVMFIVCDDGKIDESYGGSGEWGGTCHGTESTIGSTRDRTGLPTT